MKKIAFYALIVGWLEIVAAGEAHWLTSVAGSQAQAKKENKLVLMDFTGSDWCSWCMKLDKVSLHQAGIPRNTPARILSWCRWTYPLTSKPQIDRSCRRPTRNCKPSTKLNGFPTLVAIKPDGTIVWQQVGYMAGGPPAMIAELDKAKKS